MSNSGLAQRDVVSPDAVFYTDGTQVDPLDPCPNCDSRPHEAPEGVHDFHSAIKHGTEPGSPRWNFGHCWHCGYRPGTNSVIPNSVLQAKYEEMKAFLQDQWNKMVDEKANGTTPPANEQEVQDLKDQLAAAQERETQLRQQLGASSDE